MPLHSRLSALLAGVLLLSGLPALAQRGAGLDAQRYDPAIPTLSSVLGHAPGEELTTPEEITGWFARLAAAAPDRVKLVEYARSHQGRPLTYAVIARPDVMAALPAAQADMRRLASGARFPDAELRALIRRTPAVAWMSYGVHGDEVSSPEAALALSYRLVAAVGDPLVEAILANTIVVIDPLQNPDGRNRFIQTFEDARGIEPQADRFAAERDQPWPGGRFNHALFDMNRDWFALTQPETRGRVRALLEWNPVVVVDGHEMDGDQTYFFPPVADPVNPNITASQMQLEELIGRNNAAWFDRLGYDYFTREIFDAFYPGYGDMWPKLNGAIALTYEQGSPRGLLFERTSGEHLSLSDALDRHLAASLSTLEALARNKEEFLRRYAEDRRSEAEAGRTAKDRFILIDLAQRRGEAEELGRRLVLQGIETVRLSPGAQACGAVFPAGALAVDTAKPNRPLIRTLLAGNTPLPSVFMERQEERRRQGLEHELYDTTAWSVPLMDGVRTLACERIPAAAPAATPVPATAAITAEGAGFGYVAPWSDAVQARFVIAALKEGFRARTISESFSAEGRTFPAGSVVFARAWNPDDTPARLTELARRIGAELYPLNSGWVDRGVNFGSDKARELFVPKIAVAWDRGPSPTAAGATRHVLEQVLGLPATPIRTHTLAAADLDRFDVLILPDGAAYGRALGSGGNAAIKGFVERGGILIAMAGGLSYIADPDTGLSAMRRERAAGGDSGAETSPDEEAGGGLRNGVLIETEADLARITRDPDALPDTLPGALARVERTGEHVLGSGYQEAVVMVSGTEIFAPLNGADGSTVLRFSGPGDIVASGYIWEENRRQLAYKPFLTAETLGEGLIVGFTQNPVERGYLNGLNLLMANAALLAPAHAR